MAARSKPTTGRQLWQAVKKLVSTNGDVTYPLVLGLLRRGGLVALAPLAILLLLQQRLCQRRRQPAAAQGDVAHGLLRQAGGDLDVAQQALVAVLLGRPLEREDGPVQELRW
eukprot:SM000009S23605  [mRNA]  locus=s9:1048265:1049175:+ [translate_table: standard]